MGTVSEIGNYEDVIQRKLWEVIEYALEQDCTLFEVVGMLDTVKTALQMGSMIEVEEEDD